MPFVGRFQVSLSKRIYIAINIAKSSHNRSNNKIYPVVLAESLFTLKNIVIQLDKTRSNFKFSAFFQPFNLVL